jgi:hypothetical protein
LNLLRTQNGEKTKLKLKRLIEIHGGKTVRFQHSPSRRMRTRECRSYSGRNIHKNKC